MIWWNKNKEERRRDWFTVLPPTHKSIRRAKHWCDNYRTSTRYYYHYTNTRWWFEHEEDAMLFALKWSGQ